jgi:ankyrin repeat protein
LPSIIPVLLSRGANPDIKTSRGNLTPLHLACGAGNYAIVEVLLRHGCALNEPDCFGSYPIDHALRNGFSSVAQFLQAHIIKEMAMKEANNDSNSQNIENNISMVSTSSHSEVYEQEKFLVQSAFSNLSLKDKLIFNMMVRKRGNIKDNSNQLSNPTIAEEESKSSINSNAFDSGGDVQMKSNDSEKYLKKIHQGKNEELEAETVETVIPDNEKESLDIAMRLMNTEVRKHVIQA